MPATPTPLAATARPSSSRLTALVISTLALRLPLAISRAVAFADGDSVLLAGGLTASGTTATVLRIGISDGRVTTVGQLAKAVHDAGGAMVEGLPVVFGGGNLAPGTIAQRVRPDPAVIGQLPAPRADLAAVEVAGEAIVVGGGTPGQVDPAVLATPDGIHFRTIAKLGVGVRYPAVAVSGGSIIVVGGTAGSDDRSEIQAIDPANGSVRVIGDLPHGLSHAAAFSIAGRLLVAGGLADGLAQDEIWEVDPASGAVSLAGHLPMAVSDAAAIVVGGVGYLIGGENGDLMASIVSITAE